LPAAFSVVEEIIEGFASAIFLERNLPVRFHKPMISAGLENHPYTGQDKAGRISIVRPHSGYGHI
jgi:hypothetical protein